MCCDMIYIFAGKVRQSMGCEHQVLTSLLGL